VRILFIGDIVGKPGRELIRRGLPTLIDHHSIDIVIANAENSAAGLGITREIGQQLLDWGVAVMTSGNHIWDKKEALDYIGTEPRLLRPAKDLKVIVEVPKIELLGGERQRDFVLTHEAEEPYFNACPQPLKDAALLMLDTALRSGEASRLEWRDITLKVSEGKRYGYLQVRRGKSATSVRTVSLTDRVSEMLMDRKKAAETFYVFPARDGGPVPGTWLDRQHDGVRRALPFGFAAVGAAMKPVLISSTVRSCGDASRSSTIARTPPVVSRTMRPNPAGSGTRAVNRPTSPRRAWSTMAARPAAGFVYCRVISVMPSPAIAALPLTSSVMLFALGTHRTPCATNAPGPHRSVEVSFRRLRYDSMSPPLGNGSDTMAKKVLPKSLESVLGSVAPAIDTEAFKAIARDAWEEHMEREE